MRRLGFFVLLAACAPAPAPKPVSKAAPAPVVIPTPTPSAGAAAPPPAKTVPELAFEKLRASGKPLDRVFAIEGATIVTSANVAGYIDGDRVEWIAKVPKELPMIGQNHIREVHGKYLDAIDVIYGTDNGRALSPVWLPLTGKGAVPHEEAPGGQGEIMEARVGEGASTSVVLATYSGFHDYRMTTVRGPKLTRKFIDVTQCTVGWYKDRPDKTVNAAVQASATEGTPAGTLVTIGARCHVYEEPFAEIWAPGATKSKHVDLRPYWQHIGYFAAMLRAGHDELWLMSNDVQPILHYRNGAFEALPLLPLSMQQMFTSTTGQLHVLTHQGIHRWSGETWELVARLAEHEYALRDIVMDAAGTFWVSGEITDANGAQLEHEVFRLRESRQVPAESACSWYAFLADKRSEGEKAQLAELKKVVKAYPKSEALKLTIADEARRSWDHIGVAFGTKDQADAFIEYAKAALPKEHPRVLCNPPAKTK